MAAQDTLVFRDNLQYTHTNTAVLWSMDAAGSSNEAVKTYGITIPQESSTVRVLFNNFYDTSGSTVDVRVSINKVTQYSPTGVPIKTFDEAVFPWTAIGNTAPTAFVDTGAIDVSVIPSAILGIAIALTSTTPIHAGTEIICQYRAKANVNDWITFCTFIGPTGTGISMACAAANSGQKVIGVTNPSVGFDWNGKFVYYKDTVDITKSEILYQTEYGID